MGDLQRLSDFSTPGKWETRNVSGLGSDVYAGAHGGHSRKGSLESIFVGCTRRRYCKFAVFFFDISNICHIKCPLRCRCQLHPQRHGVFDVFAMIGHVGIFASSAIPIHFAKG